MTKLAVRNGWGQLDHAWEDLFNSVFNTHSRSNLLEKTKKSNYPKIDIYDKGNDTFIVAAVPGVDKDDIVIKWDDGALTIQASSQVDKESDIENYHMKELHKSSFLRSISVSEDVYNIEEVDAEVKNGMLMVKLPRHKQQEQKKEVKKIAVK